MPPKRRRGGGEPRSPGATEVAPPTCKRAKAAKDTEEMSNAEAGPKAKAHAAPSGRARPSSVAPSPGSKPPTSVREYHDRLVKQKKELYKNPPQLPPKVYVYDERKPLPARSSDGHLVFPDHPTFRPNLTPADMFQAGAFGGTYFRPITSAVTNESYKGVHEEFPREWFEGLDAASQLTSPTYVASVNKYKVSCGTSLGAWESSGWISEIDPYGWVHWYCRFYLGRRSSGTARVRWPRSASSACTDDVPPLGGHR